MFWDHVYKNRHIMQEFEDIEVHKTSVCVILGDEVMQITTMNKSLGAEKLFLFKDENYDIYVDNRNLQQHQIDGIRFLFCQFKKKKQGVIINYPEGTGKSVVLILFLNAVRKLLENPVLIICKDDDEIDMWSEQFARWSDYGDDIAIESRHTSIKKTIFLKKLINMNNYCRRDWSVVAIKEDTANWEFLRLPLTADFKIWMTTMDMTKDLQMLSQIYKWINPKKKMNVDDFSPTDDRKETLMKSILLDAFIEDFVIRKNDMTPFRNKKEIQPAIESPQIKLKKNKDATGTKIKRSKKKNEQIKKIEPYIEDIKPYDEDIIPSQYFCDTSKDIENKTTTINKPEESMDVETFIREQKCIESDDLETSFEQTPDSPVLKIEEIESLHYEDTLDENVKETENIISIDKNTNDSKMDWDNNISKKNLDESLDHNSQSVTEKSKVEPLSNKNDDKDTVSAKCNRDTLKDLENSTTTSNKRKIEEKAEIETFIREKKSIESDEFETSFEQPPASPVLNIDEVESFHFADALDENVKKTGNIISIDKNRNYSGTVSDENRETSKDIENKTTTRNKSRPEESMDIGTITRKQKSMESDEVSGTSFEQPPDSPALNIKEMESLHFTDALAEMEKNESEVENVKENITSIIDNNTNKSEINSDNNKTSKNLDLSLDHNSQNVIEKSGEPLPDKNIDEYTNQSCSMDKINRNINEGDNSKDIEDISHTEVTDMVSDDKTDKLETKVLDIKTQETNQSEKRTYKDFDSKITDLEERALKKFKGSLLDSIF